MEIYVACDICGHRYVLPGDREGRNAKCKSCGVSFAVDAENFYDPDTSELDEAEENDGQEKSSLTSRWDIAKKIGHALAGLVILSMLVWMTSLLFRSPQEAVAQNAQPVAKTMNQRPSSQFNRNPPPQSAPKTATVPPVTGGLAPPRSDGAAAHQAPRSVPPATGGSIGWPTTEPDRPTVPTPRNRKP